MKIFIQIALLVGLNISAFGQITFNGCHPLFEDQVYEFNLIEIDQTGRNVYTTTPVDGGQDCGGIGTCEFMLAWNDNEERWEFIADDGNGDFSAPYVIYSNSSASTPNPPSLLLGTWVENSSITNGECGGNLSSSNAVFTGDVQDMELSLNGNVTENRVSVYPLPASQAIKIKTLLPIKRLVVYDLKGAKVINKRAGFQEIDVSKLHSGVYVLEMESDQFKISRKITIK